MLRRLPLPAAAAAAVLTVTLGCAASPATTPAAAETEVDGESVRVWNSVTVDTLVEAQTPIPVQPLHLAYVHRAVYAAVENAPAGSSLPAAVAAAAHTVLTANFPAQQARLDAAYATALAEVTDADARDRGVAAGADAGRAELEERADDGRDGAVVLPPPPGPGVWVSPVPGAPGVASWLGEVRPFVLSAPDALRPAGPPALTSERWAGDYEETRTLGSATPAVPDEDRTEVAMFWSDPAGIQMAAALRGYSLQEELSAADTARLFALTGTASADALIACFDAKYHFNFWRPVGAIPAGDTDGNPATAPDAGWKPLLPTPPHPEYPSAHSCSTGAVATVLDGLDGDGPLSFSMSSTAAGTTHVFASGDQIIDEVADARVWGGLHWRFSTEDGVAIGREVGAQVLRSDQ